MFAMSPVMIAKSDTQDAMYSVKNMWIIGINSKNLWIKDGKNKKKRISVSLSFEENTRVIKCLNRPKDRW